MFRFGGPRQERGILEGAGGDLIHSPAVHLVGPVAIRGEADNFHHPFFPDGCQGGPHTVGPGQWFQVLAGRGKVESTQFSLQELDILLQQTGSVLGQH